MMGILISSYSQQSTLTPTTHTAKSMVNSKGMGSCRPVHISHQGDCRAERAVDDRCVLQGCQSPRPQANVETITFANKEKEDDGQNACTAVGA